MELKFIMSEQNVRRLNSILKSSESCYLVSTGGEIHFIVDNIDYFKAVTLEGDSSLPECFIEISSKVLRMIKAECAIKVKEESSRVTIEYYPIEENKPVQVWAKSFMTNSMTKLQMRVYTSVLNSRQKRVFHTDSLANIKDLVLACSVTEMGVNFSKGQAVTQSNDIKIFQELMDKDLEFSLQPKCLKELDSFKVDCESYLIGQYLVYTRNNYTLALKKGVADTSLVIPSTFLTSASSRCELTAVLHTILPELSEVTMKNLDDECYCILDFKNFRVILEDTKLKSVYKVPITVNKIDEVFSKNSINGIRIRLSDIKPLQKLLSSCAEHHIFIYDRNVKFQLKKSSALVRYTRTVVK